MRRITIIEDDEVIREELKSFLEKYGYDVYTPTNFEDIINYIKNNSTDLILLDINLPFFDGYHICKEIRKFSEVPIIIVTSRDSEIDELMSMNLGADDFITKPYNTQILILRIESIFKRVYGNIKSQTLTYKDLELDLSTAIMSHNNKKIELTKNELKILSYLINNKGKIVSRDLLMEHLWQSDCFVEDSVLTVNITRVRKSLRKLD